MTRKHWSELPKRKLPFDRKHFMRHYMRPYMREYRAAKRNGMSISEWREWNEAMRAYDETPLADTR